MKNLKPVLVIIVPCCNEEEVFPETAKRLSGKIAQLVSNQRISPRSTLLFVDDGSQDNTWPLIEKYHLQNPQVFSGIKLSGNTGHQNALLCGLLFVRNYADVTITIDADLQDDAGAIDKMLETYFSGAEIVLGIRSNRKTDSFFKRTSARFFYRVMRLLGAGLVENHADFRLMCRETINALAEYGESDLFIRGIVPKLGFETGVVYYNREKRFTGKSKYTLQKMLKLAWLAFTGIGSAREKKGRSKQHPKYHIEKSFMQGVN